MSGQAKTVLERCLPAPSRGQENSIADQVPQLIDPSLSVEEAARRRLRSSNRSSSPNLEVDDAEDQASSKGRRAGDDRAGAVSYTKNQVIVRSGDVIDSTAIEAMREAGLLSRRLEWRSVAAVIVLSVISAGILGYYIYAFRTENAADLRRLVLCSR